MLSLICLSRDRPSTGPPAAAAAFARMSILLGMIFFLLLVFRFNYRKLF